MLLAIVTLPKGWMINSRLLVELKNPPVMVASPSARTPPLSTPIKDIGLIVIAVLLASVRKLTVIWLVASTAPDSDMLARCAYVADISLAVRRRRRLVPPFASPVLESR